MTREITTEATAEREAQPDIASIEVEAVGKGNSQEVAHAAAQDHAATIHESLTETSVPEDRIRTSEIRVEEVPEMFDCDSDADYQSVEKLYVECAPETVSEVFRMATSAGGTVSTVRFGLHDDIREHLQEEVISEAVERSRQKAERIASVEELEITGVQQVTTTEEETGFLSEEETFLEGTNLCPSPITVSETVEVTYKFSDD